MLQYTSCPDPTESVARRERLRQSEEEGEFEETARNMAREAMNHEREVASKQQQNTVLAQTESPKRVPARLRL